MADVVLGAERGSGGICGYEGLEAGLDGVECVAQVGSFGEGVQEGEHGVGGYFADGQKEVSYQVRVCKTCG